MKIENEHTLTPQDDWLFEGDYQDPMAQTKFKIGDDVVVCGICTTIHFSGSWETIGSCPSERKRKTHDKATHTTTVKFDKALFGNRAKIIIPPAVTSAQTNEDRIHNNQPNTARPANTATFVPPTQPNTTRTVPPIQSIPNRIRSVIRWIIAIIGGGLSTINRTVIGWIVASIILLLLLFLVIPRIDFSPADYEPEYTATSELRGRVNVSALNMRSDSNASSDIVDTLAENTDVKIVNRLDNGWCYIVLDKNDPPLDGYVKGEYLTIASSDIIDKLPENTDVKIENSATLAIGDRGQGGGIVFYINGNKYFEVSENLGSTTWKNAKTLAKNYRGGGYNDWYLPSKDELNYIYENLRVASFISDNGSFWSSSGRNFNLSKAWSQGFDDGHRHDNLYKRNSLGVRAVRDFNMRSDSNASSDIIDTLPENAGAKIENNATLAIGDRGQGGGIVFYISGNEYLEVSENLRKVTWEDAKISAKNYRGGGYDDWYLPSKDELNYIYENLRVEGFISDNEWFWSSEGDNDDAWRQDFSNGLQLFTAGYYYNYYYSENIKCGVMVVRALNMNSDSNASSDIIDTLPENADVKIENSTTIVTEPIEKGLIETVLVKAGSFEMGSYDVLDSEKPVHIVTLTNDYYMGKYEVTQKQYYEVMGNKPSYKNPTTGWENLPVEKVSWYDAVAFCNALSEQEGVEPYYSINGTRVRIVDANGKGYRLPTEAEWEYAARGGKEGDHSLEYAGSNNIDHVAWYYGYRTQEVGKKQANGLGLYDMSGNVWEWCWDWYEDYTSGNSTDPTGATRGSSRVFRGGSYNDNYAISCRVAYRISTDPSRSSIERGFRVVCFQ